MQKLILRHGDCVEVLKGYEDGSLGAFCSDPPYDLTAVSRGGSARQAGTGPFGRHELDTKNPRGGFMGKAWDGTGIAFSADLWDEVYRTLRPGGVVKAFSGTRTFHRMAAAMQEAGFVDLRVESWNYGSGFPKSLDLSKSMDKMRDERAQILQVTEWIAKARDSAGLSNRDIDAHFSTNGMAGHWTSTKSQPAVPTLDQWERLVALLGVEVPPEVHRLAWELNGRKGEPGAAWFDREVTGTRTDGAGNGSVVGLGSDRSMDTVFDITAPATEAAQQWTGWGTALKPSWEPVVVGRKPE